MEIDNKKRDVEESIMRGFATNSNPSTPVVDGSPGQQNSPLTPGAAPELDRPEVEALTPPGYPQPPAVEPVPEFDLSASTTVVQPAGSDLLSSLSHPYHGGGSAKKRKLSTGNEFPDLGGDAMDGLDEDVAEMLRRDSGGPGAF